MLLLLFLTFRQQIHSIHEVAFKTLLVNIII